jgi:Flp pilus assembly pilin Flp
VTTVRNFWKDDQDRGLIEYNLLMAFVALASVALVLSAAGGIAGIWSAPNSLLASANARIW